MPYAETAKPGQIVLPKAWQDIAKGAIKADNFGGNGKWVPWYNLHKTYAGLRDAHRHGGNQDARAMLVAMADWALKLTAALSDEPMQSMLRSEHGGMNEVLATATGRLRHAA